MATDETTTATSSGAGASATAQAQAAFEEYRRRMAASRPRMWSPPGFGLGQTAPPFGPGPLPFGPSPFQTGPQVGSSLGQSLATMIRLSLDLVNAGLQELARSFSGSGGFSREYQDCGCDCCDCCGSYSGSCGCGCNPSVRNCP